MLYSYQGMTDRILSEEKDAIKKDDKSDAASKEKGIVLPTYPTGDSRDWEGFLKLFFPNMKMQFHEETKKVKSSNSGT